ncbi:3692_t:CDS:1, partial [Paraglomus brasilianum]
PELRQYFTRQWWGYIFLWGNINKRVADCTRRTTATIEVQHKILKTFDITKKNLAIDEYLLQHTSIISANQLILAKKLLFKSSIMELKQRKLEKPDDDEKWSKNLIKLDESKLQFLEAFRNVYNDCGTTQTKCAREIRDISGGKSKIQQSVVLRMLRKTYFPKEPATLQAVKSWMTMKKQGKIYLDE